MNHADRMQEPWRVAKGGTSGESSGAGGSGGAGGAGGAGVSACSSGKDAAGGTG